MRSLPSLAAAMSFWTITGCNLAGPELAHASYSVLACGSDAGAPCPSPPPSYADEVAPILGAKCNNCHSGEAGLWPLTDHYQVTAWRDLVFLDVVQCTMPPADAGAGAALSESERATLLAWLSCGAPDN